jgi:hypothetical protein
MAKNGNRKAGGGYGSAVNREVGNRLGKGAQEMRPRGASQIGSSIGNKSTESGVVKGVPSEKIQGARLPQGLSVPLGNEVALNVGAGGAGKGRDYVSKSGSNCVTGPTTGTRKADNLGGDILRDFGPDVPGRRR